MTELTPGCFGSVLSYDDADSTCEACKHAQNCEERRHESLLALREKMNISHIVKKHNVKRTKANLSTIEIAPVAKTAIPVFAPPAVVKPRGTDMLTSEQMTLIDGIPQKKARDTVVRLFKRGIDVGYMRGTLKRGLNPLANQTPRFLATACDMLLSGGFSRAELATAFVRGGMSLQTAYSHVAIALASLPALGVATEKDGRITLNKEGL